MCKQSGNSGLKTGCCKLHGPCVTTRLVCHYTARVLLHGLGPCNLLEWNCGGLHWHKDLHGSALATQA